MSLLPPRRPPGTRGRIGIIQPAPGVMLEHEWPNWLPPEILFPVGRIRLPSPTSTGYAQMAQVAPEMAKDLVFAGASVVAYACTIGSLFAGAAAEAEMVAAIAAACGTPVISLANTCVEALRSVGASRLAIMTPYDEPTNQWVADYIASQGFTIAGFIPTPVGIVQVGALQPAEIAAIAIAGMAKIPGADALWIPCTAIQTMGAIATIEAVSGRPAISGTQALLWHALRILAIPDPIGGAGCLFNSEGTFR